MENNSSANRSQCILKPKESRQTLYGKAFIPLSGFWFCPPEHAKGTQEMVTNFKPFPSDIILASFPKTGTTWLKALLFSIVNRSSPTTRSLITTHNPHTLICRIEHDIYGSNPQEITNFLGSSNMSSTRIMSTHVPYQILEDNVYASDCRVVYVTRNPKDAILSFWHFVPNFTINEEDSVTLGDLVDMFCDGRVPNGPYYDHVLGYWKKSLEMPKKVFFITYEELQEDPITHVKSLGKFLGCPFESDEEVEEIVRSCSFENLTKYEINKSNKSILPWVKIPCNIFFRRGKVGDHLNYMNREMIEKIDSITKEKFHGSGFMYGI